MKIRPLRWMTVGPSLTANPRVSHASVGTAMRVGVPVIVHGLVIRAM
jgi:hypothetical protein